MMVTSWCVNDLLESRWGADLRCVGQRYQKSSLQHSLAYPLSPPMDLLCKILVHQRVDLPPPISQGQAPNQYKVCGGASKSEVVLVFNILMRRFLVEKSSAYGS